MKPLFPLSSVLGGLLLLGSCEPTTVEPANQTFTLDNGILVFESGKAFEKTYTEVLALSDAEFLQWESQNGFQSQATAFDAATEELLRSASAEEVYARLDEFRDVLFISPENEVLPHASRSGIGRLLGPEGLLVIGEEAHRYVKGFEFTTVRESQVLLSRVKVSDDYQVEVLPIGVSLVYSPEAAQERIELDCGTLLTRQGNCTDRDEKRKVKMWARSMWKYVYEGIVKHYIEIELFPQKKAFGFWWNYAVNLKYSNGSGSIRTWEDNDWRTTGLDPYIKNYVYTHQSDTHQNSKGFINSYTVGYIDVGEYGSTPFPSGWNSQLYWNYKNGLGYSADTYPISATVACN